MLLLLNKYKFKLLKYNLITITILYFIIFNNIIIFNAKAQGNQFFNFNENDTPNNSDFINNEPVDFNPADHMHFQFDFNNRPHDDFNNRPRDDFNNRPRDDFNNRPRNDFNNGHNIFDHLIEFYNELSTLSLISYHLINKDLKLFIQNINSNLFYFEIYTNLYFNINYNFEISDLYIDKINNFILSYSIFNLNFKYLLSPSFIINFSAAVSYSQNKKKFEFYNSTKKILNVIDKAKYDDKSFNNTCVYYSLFFTNIIDLNKQIKYGFIFQESFINKLNNNDINNLLEPLLKSHIYDYIFFYKYNKNNKYC